MLNSSCGNGNGDGEVRVVCGVLCVVLSVSVVVGLFLSSLSCLVIFLCVLPLLGHCLGHGLGLVLVMLMVMAFVMESSSWSWSGNLCLSLFVFVTVTKFNPN